MDNLKHNNVTLETTNNPRQPSLDLCTIKNQTHSTINTSLSGDAIILDEPNLNCHEHVVCCSPRKSPSREDIMIQNKENMPFKDNEEPHLLRDVNNILPQLTLYPPSHKPSPKPKLTLYPPLHPLHPSNKSKLTLYLPSHPLHPSNVSQQSSDDTISHTYNT